MNFMSCGRPCLRVWWAGSSETLQWTFFSAIGGFSLGCGDLILWTTLVTAVTTFRSGCWTVFAFCWSWFYLAALLIFISVFNLDIPWLFQQWIWTKQLTHVLRVDHWEVLGGVGNLVQHLLKLRLLGLLQKPIVRTSIWKLSQICLVVAMQSLVILICIIWIGTSLDHAMKLKTHGMMNHWNVHLSLVNLTLRACLDLKC